MVSTASSEQPQPQDRFMAVVFTEPWPEQSDMPAWHQHLTVFPWVRGNLAATGQALEQFAPAVKPIIATVVEVADSLDQAPLPAWLLDPAQVLRGLHNVCLAHLTNRANLEDARFTGENYTPHITAHARHTQLHIGDRVAIDAISLVQKIGDRRVIAKTIEFGNA